MCQTVPLREPLSSCSPNRVARDPASVAVPWSIMLKIHPKAPTLPLPRSYSQLKRHGLTDIADIEAHSCIADLATRAACCRYLPLIATRSENAIAEPAHGRGLARTRQGSAGNPQEKTRRELNH